MHRALDHRIGRFRVHRIQNAVDGLVAAGSQNRRAQNFAAVRIHQDLHEAERLALFHGAPHSRHGSRSHQCALAGFPHFRLRHARSSQRRIDVEPVGGDPVADAPRVVVQQIGGYDFIIVVRSMGEAAMAVAVAERPDARHIGRKRIVDRDVAVGIERHAGVFQAEIVRIRPAADRQQ